MGRLKKAQIMVSLGEGLGSASIDVVFFVNTAGEFYCEIPNELTSYFENYKNYDSVSCKLNSVKRLSLYCAELSKLESVLEDALKSANKPIVAEEYVIRYNIESHVAFAETPDGRIHPNATSTDAQWLSREREARFGKHYSANTSKGGYSLCIGAKALVKTTTTVGSKKTINYSSYYKSDLHPEQDDPAGTLNAWTAFTLPENAKEIPYTDEAALFFHKLMLAMATISRQIQDATFDQPSLIQLIESQQNLLLMGPK